jgi:hypothetical protein
MMDDCTKEMIRCLISMGSSINARSSDRVIYFEMQSSLGSLRIINYPK